MNADPDFLTILRAGLGNVLRRPSPEIAPPDIDEGTPLSGLGLDSVGVIELVGHVEDTLSIQIRDDDLAGLRTVGDLGALVARIRSEAA